MDRTNKLNDYITILPNEIDDYKIKNYYALLLFLYKKKDSTLPQHFMLIGNNFKRDKEVIKDNLVVYSVYLFIIGSFGLLQFILNKGNILLKYIQFNDYEIVLINKNV